MPASSGQAGCVPEIYYPVNAPPYDDERVRQALSHSLDLDSFGLRVNPVPSEINDIAFEDLTGYITIDVLGSGFRVAGLSGAEYALLPSAEYDIAEANRLLLQSSYQYSNDRVLVGVQTLVEEDYYDKALNFVLDSWEKLRLDSLVFLEFKGMIPEKEFAVLMVDCGPAR